MSWYYQKYPLSLLGTTPKITHQLFWMSSVGKAKVLYRHRTGNPEVTFLLDLVVGVCDSWPAEYPNCAAHRTETGSPAEVCTECLKLLGECDAKPRGELAQPRSSRHGTKGAGKAHDSGSTKQLLCLQGQPGCAGTWLCLHGVVSGAFDLLSSDWPRRELLWASDPPRHSMTVTVTWPPYLRWLRVVCWRILLLSLVTSNVFHRISFVVWFFFWFFLISFNLIPITVTQSALEENPYSFLYKICLWRVSRQHINSCWIPPVLLIFLEIKYFISNGYYCS